MALCVLCRFLAGEGEEEACYEAIMDLCMERTGADASALLAPVPSCSWD
jgi:hypothetical protein